MARPARPARPAGAARRPDALPIDLALQGGGSHGAFTWGVLDRLLDEPELRFDGVSGTSAGALNAAVLATGLAEGGPAGAQAALRNFWLDVAAQGACFGQWPHAPGSGLAGYNLDNNPFFVFSNIFLRAFSPYQFNPTRDNPLRAVLKNHVQAGGTEERAAAAVRHRHLGAYRPAAGVRPQRHQHRRAAGQRLPAAAVPGRARSTGEAYWDGGYTGNPAIWPLIYNTGALDLVLVKINALQRPEVPDTAEEISRPRQRGHLQRRPDRRDARHRLRAALIEKGQLSPGEYKNLRLHMVADDAGLAPLHGSSKLNTSREFLEALHALGHAAAQNWLTLHRKDLGRKSTLDLRATFLQPKPHG